MSSGGLIPWSDRAQIALSRIDETVDVDVVVIGSGIAGLTCAVALAGKRVAVVTKTPSLIGGSSPLAQGGVAAALGPADSGAAHGRDTITVGSGLSDAGAVEALVSGAPSAIEHLVELGLHFDREPSGELQLAREGGHSRERVVHAGGDRTGSRIVATLVDSVVASPWIETFTSCMVLELTVCDGEVVGALAECRLTGKSTFFRSAAVVVATGGYGRLYRWTTNAPESTGDGIVMAARAGAAIADLEFIQFHPTALDAGLDPLPLVTEALRGAGAALRDAGGERFMKGVHRDAELAPRDVVARAIWHRARQTGGSVFLDATSAVGESFPTRFPTVYSACVEVGIDPRQEWIPVKPAAHYSIGGISTDLEGRATVRGLYACGEAAANGLHGGNRLASNSLAEALVFGQGLARSISSRPPRRGRLRAAPRFHASSLRRTTDTDLELRRSVRETMWNEVGLERGAVGLEHARRALEALASRARRADIETQNLWSLASMVVVAAAARTHSCGCHFRVDGVIDDNPQRKCWLSSQEGELGPRLVELLPRRTRRAIA